MVIEHSFLAGKEGYSHASYAIVYYYFQTWDGPFGPSSPDQLWPIARGVHATSCLVVVDSESELAPEHQQLEEKGWMQYTMFACSMFPVELGRRYVRERVMEAELIYPCMVRQRFIW